MNERRKNLKVILTDEQQQFAKRQELLTQLENVRVELRNIVGFDFKKYDELKLKQREITAKLATL